MEISAQYCLISTNISQLRSELNYDPASRSLSRISFGCIARSIWYPVTAFSQFLHSFPRNCFSSLDPGLQSLTPYRGWYQALDSPPIDVTRGYVELPATDLMSALPSIDLGFMRSGNLRPTLRLKPLFENSTKPLQVRLRSLIIIFSPVYSNVICCETDKFSICGLAASEERAMRKLEVEQPRSTRSFGRY